MTIAVEFDGVIVEDEFPAIGAERAFAFDTLKRLKSRGHQIVLWSRRHGTLLDEAVAFCEEHGVRFYAVNKSYPEEKFDDENMRKINADLFIDTRMPGHVPDWGAIYQMVKFNQYDKPFDPDIAMKPKTSFFDKIFKR